MKLLFLQKKAIDLQKYFNMGKIDFRLHDRNQLDKSMEPSLYGNDPLDNIWSMGDSLQLIENRKSVHSHG